MADSKEKLFSDFAPTTTEQWMDKVTADLKGADFEKKRRIQGETFLPHGRPRRTENDGRTSR